MAILGHNILIYSGSTLIAAVKSMQTRNDADMIEKSSATQSDYKEFVPGRKSWTVNLGYLLMANADVQHLLLVGNYYTLKIMGRGASITTGVQGHAWLKTCDINAVEGNLATGAFIFVGSGELEAIHAAQ